MGAQCIQIFDSWGSLHTETETSPEPFLTFPLPNDLIWPRSRPPQIDSGAQCIQIFDSWGGQLPPREWDRWSGPYLKQIVQSVKATHPNVPLTVYANGSGGLLEVRLKFEIRTFEFLSTCEDDARGPSPCSPTAAAACWRCA